MHNQKSSTLAIFALLLSTLLYSAFGVLTRIIGFDLPIFFASFSRDILASLLLLIPLFFLGKLRRVQLRDWPWLIARTAGGCVGFLGSFYAFYYLPIGTAYFIFYGGSTIFGFLFGAFLFGEKINLIESFSLLISLSGLLLIYSVGGVSAELLPYVIWAFAGGIGGAMWSTFSKKVSGAYDSMQLNALDFAITAVLMGILSVIKQEQWLWPSFNLLWLANLLFLVMFVITGYLMIYGFKHLDAQKGSLIMLLEVVFGAVIGVIFYNEQLGVGAWLGGALILLGAALPSLQKVLPSRQNWNLNAVLNEILCLI